MKSWIRHTFAQTLHCLDLRIHREILRLRVSYQLSLDEFRGLYISDSQVDTLINEEHGVDAGVDIGIDEINERIQSIEHRSLDALQGDEPWQRLCSVYQLTPAEQDIIFIALSPELDPKYETIYAYLNNDITRKYPTVELALRLCAEPEQCRYQQAFANENKLFRLGLIAKTANTSSHYHLQRGFQLSPIVRDFLLYGALALPAANELLHALPYTGRAWSSLPFPADVLTSFQTHSERMSEPDYLGHFILIAGKNSAGEMLLSHMFFKHSKAVASLDLHRLASFSGSITKELDHLLQYLRLTDTSLVINLHAIDGGEKDSNLELCRLLAQRFFSNTTKTAFILSTKHRCHALFTQHNGHRLTLALPGARQREMIWHECFNAQNLANESATFSSVAEFFKLDYQQIDNAVRQLALCSSPTHDSKTQVSNNALFAAATLQSYSEIGDLATLVKNDFSLENLILPQDTLARIREIISATRNRRLVYEDWGFGARVGNARGILTLFSGASGTGKTMSASVIANVIGLDLYRVDLSRIVSKYIGETEKNLNKIFTAAEQANCILFFDEADALLGKRSEVKDAHDRYANVEVAYLLQKMEEHEGLVILTTNLAKNIDQAFTRRLQFIIEFPRPDQYHREKIWLSMFDQNAPLHSDVDFNFLARQFNNTGGDIKNIALDAAMLAAESENQCIDMPLLIRAAARQMVKQGKVPSASEFKHFFGLVSSGH